MFAQNRRYFANIVLEGDSSLAIIFVLRHKRSETKRFLPVERSHNRRVPASSFLRALAVDDYFKKASSDYARLIGWESYDNCEVN